MEEGLDHILLEQLHNCKRGLKTIARLRKLFGRDPYFDLGEKQIYKKIVYYENMIADKSLLNKKVTKKVKKREDVLSKNYWYEIYKNSYVISYISYKFVISTMISYFNLFQQRKMKK